MIGQVDETTTLELINEKHQTLFTKNITTEKEDVNNTSFTGLQQLPPGNYIVRYTYGSEDAREVAVRKLPLLSNWLQASPNPFGNNMIVYIKAPETGNASVRLINASGKIFAVNNLNITENEIYTINFNTSKLSNRGVYFVQISANKTKAQ